HGHWVATAADEAHPHALSVQLRSLGLDPPGEHVHQRGDLAIGAIPVLGRERVDGQLGDAQRHRITEPGLDGVGAGLVPGDDGQPSLLGPAAVSVGDDRDIAGPLRHVGAVCLHSAAHYTSKISSSLCLSSSSSSEIRVSVTFCSSTSARCSSSEPASPASLSSRRSCITSRRTLRIATPPSSAMFLTTLTSWRRRSSVSSGTTRRIRFPSLDGDRPTSDSRIERSIALIEVLS